MVSLVSVTRPQGSATHLLTAEDLIVYTARVSSPKNQDNLATGPKLLAYLIKHKHWSPFEMVHMTVEVTTSRAIAAQLLRHKSFSFQEFSQRYSTVDSYESYEARRQDSKDRQNSVDDLPSHVKQEFLDAQAKVFAYSHDLYSKALQAGIAKECARFLLPVNTTTRLYVCGSVRSWIHYLEVRCGPSTQKEHRDIANGIRLIFENQFPQIAEAMRPEQAETSR